MEFLSLLPIPLITATVEFFKYLGMPKKMARICALLLALIATVFFFFQKDIVINIVQTFIYFLSAIGVYESALKPLKEEVTRE